MKKLIAAAVVSVFAFGAASSFAADVPAKPVQQHAVKADKAHKSHKKVRKVHAVKHAQAATMHQVKLTHKHGQKHVGKAAR